MSPRPRAARDAEIREQLEPLLERAARGEFASWAASPKRRLALIILFDQVPRNAYRGTAAAFAFDREALALTVEGLQLAADAALEPLERLFFYLPLEHAESLEAQEAAVAAFERLVARSARTTCATTARTARASRASIATSSRSSGGFRIAMRVLERESTAAEIEWLAAKANDSGNEDRGQAPFSRKRGLTPFSVGDVGLDEAPGDFGKFRLDALFERVY